MATGTQKKRETGAAMDIDPNETEEEREAREVSRPSERRGRRRSEKLLYEERERKNQYPCAGLYIT